LGGVSGYWLEKRKGIRKRENKLLLETGGGRKLLKKDREERKRFPKVYVKGFVAKGGI